MTNTSATGGYIQPISGTPAPLEDSALDIFLQKMIVGITGLAGSLTFLRWQPAPPNWPSPSVGWAAMGISTYDSGFNYEAHDPVLITPLPSPPPDGYDITIEQQEIELLISFYGPAARSTASLFRSGINVAQNRELLTANGFGFRTCGKIDALPEMINGQWYFRADVPVYMKREIVRYYPIQDIVSAQINLESDTGFTETINIEP